MSSPGYRLVAAARELKASDRFFARFKRVGLRGVLADLDRAGAHADVPGEASIAGMTWQDDDRDTLRWFPQGITTSADAYGADPSGGMFEGHDIVMVSWYARGWRGWLQLGARISVIDWKDEGEGEPRYRHVLLTQPQKVLWFHRLRPVRVHAGGIVWYGKHLFVAGSSSGVRVFRLDDIVRVRNRLRSKGYRYVLPQCSRYVGEHDEGRRMTYSFMSLDRAGAEDHLVAGEYNRRGGSHRLIRYAIDRDTELLRSDDRGWAVATELHDRQIARMQGAAVVNGTWVIMSTNGEDNPGDLWVGTPGDYTRHAGVLPTGTEDITYLPQRRWLWSLTEWPGRRWVYAIDADRWLGPPPIDDVTP